MKVNLSEFLKIDKNVNSAIATAIAKASNEALEIVFDQKEYRFDESNCTVKVIFMTNTVSEKEMPIPERKIGILIENANNVTLNGNGAKLLYNGRLTEFALLNCHNFVVKNFVVDFEIPTVFEFDIVGKGSNYIDITPNMDSPYTLENGKMKFLVDDYANGMVIQECDRKAEITKRINLLSWGKNIFSKQLGAVTLENNTFRITFLPTAITFLNVGLRYQICSPRRDACGTFLERCSNVTLSHNTYNFMHGMGILAQLCENVTIENCDFLPNYEHDRTTACFADMIHCSMCKGQVKVVNCNFDGSRDDIINVHGNHFLVKKICGKQMFLHYRHPQTYGIDAFDQGDIIEFISPASLLAIEQNEIISSEITSPRVIKVTLKNAPSIKVRSGCYLENVTRTASLYVDNIVAKNIPTRGILVTTRQPVVIKNCTFKKLFMSAVLVSDDAKGWYESGYVRDIKIENNTFDNCLDLIVDIRPETKSLCYKKPVHKNIVIKNNIVKSDNPSKFFLKNVENVVFDNNTFEGAKQFVVTKCHAKNITYVNQNNN